MKNLFLTALLAASMLTATPAFAAGETVHVKVNGLVCEFCAKALEKVFIGTEKVETLDVDLDSALITIVMKDGQAFTDEEITAHVTDSGYAVENIHHMTEKTDE